MEKRKKKKETNRLVVCLLFFGKFNENLKLKKIKSRISVKVDERRIKNQLIERRKKKLKVRWQTDWSYLGSTFVKDDLDVKDGAKLLPRRTKRDEMAQEKKQTKEKNRIVLGCGDECK